MKHKGKRKRIYRKKVHAVAENENAFPGYPHYSPEEDVMVHAKREKIDIEKFPERVPVKSKPPGKSTKDKEIVPGTEADVKKEDLVALGPEESDMDMGDDEVMALSGDRYDRTDDDLDIPGAELDDENEEIGSEDEENNYYSLGGDRENTS